MGIKFQLELMIGEYLSKVKDCDSCVSQYFCIKNDLRKSREPQDYCKDNLKAYLALRDIPNYLR